MVKAKFKKGDNVKCHVRGKWYNGSIVNCRDVNGLYNVFYTGYLGNGLVEMIDEERLKLRKND